MEICRLILKKRLKIKWSCMTRSDSVDKEMLKAMSAQDVLRYLMA